MKVITLPLLLHCEVLIVMKWQENLSKYEDMPLGDTLIWSKFKFNCWTSSQGPNLFCTKEMMMYTFSLIEDSLTFSVILMRQYTGEGIRAVCIFLYFSHPHIYSEASGCVRFLVRLPDDYEGVLTIDDLYIACVCRGKGSSITCGHVNLFNKSEAAIQAGFCYSSSRDIAEKFELEV